MYSPCRLLRETGRLLGDGHGLREDRNQSTFTNPLLLRNGTDTSLGPDSESRVKALIEDLDYFNSLALIA